jgi:hypothetical protein
MFLPLSSISLPIVLLAAGSHALIARRQPLSPCKGGRVYDLCPMLAGSSGEAPEWSVDFEIGPGSRYGEEGVGLREVSALGPC